MASFLNCLDLQKYALYDIFNMKKSFLLVAILGVIVIGVLIFIFSSNQINETPLPAEDILSTPENSFSLNMRISSPAFINNGSIPSKYSCDAAAPISPPLSFSNIPEDTKSIALIMQDPDVPKQVLPAGVFDHWIAYNIPPTTTDISEGAAPGIQGANGAGKTGYTPPCPPVQYEPSEHRYVFNVYALDSTIDLPAGATKQQVLAAIEGHVLGLAELVGKYKKATINN